MASDPEFMNMIESIGEGNVEARASAAREIGSVKPMALMGPTNLSTCAWIAAFTRGLA